MKKGFFSFLLAFCFSIISAQCIEGNCNNGYGTAIFKKKGGIRYIGYFKNKRPNGKGTAEYPNGRVYSGDWMMGMWHGQGTLTLTDGSNLNGHWEYNKLRNISENTPIYTNTHDNSNNEFQSAEKAAKKTAQRSTSSGANAYNDSRAGDLSPSGIRTLPEIWAVAIGVSQYDNQTIPSLKYPDNDAFGIFSFWKSPGGGALDDDHSEVLVDDAATKAMVTTTLRNVFMKAKEDDLAIFFFSGHGLKGSFLPSDYDGDKVRLYHSEINKILTECRAKNKLIIADACHSGSYIASKGVMTNKPTKENRSLFYEELSKAQPGIAYLLSSQADEESLEVSTLHNSVFTYFVLRGLKGEANANQDTIITIQELYDYVYLNVTDYARKLGKVQTPIIKGNYDPNMPVAIIRR